jgi:predicted permease
MPDPLTSDASRRASWAREVRGRLSSLRLSPTRQTEIVDELSQHLEDLYAEQVAGGASPEEAAGAALASFRSRDLLAQNLAPLRQAHATAPVVPGAPAGHVLGELWYDVRYAARVLLKQPGSAILTALTLAVGIGANAAIFSVVNGVLLKPLPFADPERLVAVWHRAPGMNMSQVEQGAATYLTYRESNRVFEDIAVWDSEEVSITGHGEPERVSALLITDGLLPIVRVQPRLGRLFTRADDAPGSARRVILSYGYWQRRFSGAADAVGRSLNIDGSPYEVIGILPSSFKFMRTDPAVVLPFRFDPADVRFGDFGYRAVARLKPGITLDQANADVARMIPLAVDRFPMWLGLTRKMFEEARLGPDVHGLAQDVIGDAGRVLWILAGTVGIVLLIACANVANLFLVRTEGRQRELAVRVALGASRSRIVRQLLAESVVLALSGGALGILLAWPGIQLLVRLAPAGLPRVEDIGIDVTVGLFTVTISVLTGLLFGLIPALRFGMPGAVGLKNANWSGGDAPARHRSRNTLVVSEIALALVLLIFAGLMIRTFVALRHVDPGFVRPREVQTFRLSIPTAVIKDPHQIVSVYQQITDRLHQVPGVVSVGLSWSVAMDGNVASTPILVEQFPEAGREMPPIRRHKRIGPGYFETMGTRLIAGRAIRWTDIQQGRPVVVVSENFAREYWRNPAAAVGKRLRQNRENPWREIVGVVGNERDDGLDQPATTVVYWPLLINEWWNDAVDVSRTMSFVIRSDRAGSAGFVRELQQAVWSVNPNLPLASVRTLNDIQAGSMAKTSFALVMLAIAAAVALLIGTVGIYGVIAYAAAQRTREIGIRVALGAQTRDVRRLFLRHGIVLTAAGVGLGIVVALALTRVMSALLFGVSPTDPVTYVSVSAGLATVAVLATYLPARRAARVDPAVALRVDV